MSRSTRAGAPQPGRVQLCRCHALTHTRHTPPPRHTDTCRSSNWPCASAELVALVCAWFGSHLCCFSRHARTGLAPPYPVFGALDIASKPRLAVLLERSGGVGSVCFGRLADAGWRFQLLAIRCVLVSGSRGSIGRLPGAFEICCSSPEMSKASEGAHPLRGWAPLELSWYGCGSCMPMRSLSWSCRLGACERPAISFVIFANL